MLWAYLNVKSLSLGISVLYHLWKGKAKWSEPLGCIFLWSLFQWSKIDTKKWPRERGRERRGAGKNSCNYVIEGPFHSLLFRGFLLWCWDEFLKEENSWFLWHALLEGILGWFDCLFEQEGCFMGPYKNWWPHSHLYLMKSGDVFNNLQWKLHPVLFMSWNWYETLGFPGNIAEPGVHGSGLQQWNPGFERTLSHDAH